MKKNKIIVCSSALFFTMLLSCTVQQPNLYSWNNYTIASYNFVKTRSSADKDALMKTYKTMISKPTGKRNAFLQAFTPTTDIC